MIDRQAALTTLRLTEGASRADIIAAYSRLARRYPLQQFPERHTRLLEAKTLLLSPELAFKNILFEEQIDLSWLNPYSIDEDKANKNPTDSDQNPLQTCLQALFRPHFKKGSMLFPMNEVHMEKTLSRLFDELGPKGLEELMGGFKFP